MATQELCGLANQDGKREGKGTGDIRGEGLIDRERGESLKFLRRLEKWVDAREWCWSMAWICRGGSNMCTTR